ncbi:M20/M25/M40 family metallo-hydrolase [Halorubrum sp. DTA98]|uniref:M20/M25/M40 family metallo-hydrolase n=1 Tax=Halorubrum sp. DTA98 TaxID=3402163 RepID=UPI003AAEC910
MSGNRRERSGSDTAFDPIGFLERAVATPSHEDVSAMRTLLVETLSSSGVDADVVAGGCVVATKASPAPAEGPHLVLNTHIDTVTPHVSFERDREATGPDAGGAKTGGSDAGGADTGGSDAGGSEETKAEERASVDRVDVIRGRGSCDAKGPLAALLSGFLASEPERGRVTLAVTPDEEALSLGAAELVGLLPGSDDRLDGDLFIVGEPTGLDVCPAAKGRFQGTVELSGVAAHAAEFEGVNAVAAAEEALRAIRTFDDGAAAHPQLGPPKLTPTVIDGGSATNQVPADCAITVDRRSIPPETAEGFRSALASSVRAETPSDVDVTFDLTDRDSPFLEAFSTEPTHELVDALATAARAGGVDAGLPDGRGGTVRPFAAATEASYFAPAPTVVFGPGDLADDAGAVAHAQREYVRVREVEVAAHAIEHAIDALL